MKRRLTLELRMVLEVDDDRALQPVTQAAFREFLRVHIGKDAEHPIPFEHTAEIKDGGEIIGTLHWKALNEHFTAPGVLVEDPIPADPNRIILVEP